MIMIKLFFWLNWIVRGYRKRLPFKEYVKYIAHEHTYTGKIEIIQGVRFIKCDNPHCNMYNPIDHDELIKSTIDIK